MRARLVQSILHGIMDKAANHNTAVPYRSGALGKQANKVQLKLGLMMHILFGFGLAPVVELPW